MRHTDDDGPKARVLTVLTTTDTEDKARDLARGAVGARVAACAQIAGPVTSVYRWEGALESAREWQVLFKTATDRYSALEAWLTGAHDYDTPEIIATPVVRGSAAYVEWVERETAADGDMDLDSDGGRGGGEGAGADQGEGGGAGADQGEGGGADRDVKARADGEGGA